MLKNKWFVGVLITAAVLLIGGYLIWNYVTSTPQYSMYQLRKAMRSGDVGTAEQYIDVDGLSGQIVDVASDKIKEEVAKQAVPSDSLFGKDFYDGLLALMLPSIKSELSKSFQSSLEDYIQNKGQVQDDNENQVAFLQTLNDKSAKDLYTNKGIEFTRNKDVASMTLKGIQDKDGNSYDVQFKLEKVTDKRWQITEWENLSDILDHIVDTSKLTLPDGTTGTVGN